VVEDDDEPLTPNKADGAAKDREGAITDSEVAGVEVRVAPLGAAKGAAKVPVVIVVEDDDEPLTPNKADGAVKDREGAITDSEVAGVEVEPLTPNKRRRL
jgi:hypothetical protein